MVIVVAITVTINWVTDKPMVIPVAVICCVLAKILVIRVGLLWDFDQDLTFLYFIKQIYNHIYVFYIKY